MRKKWDFNSCKKEASKYKTKSSFQKESGGCYTISRKNNWLSRICSHMVELKKPNGYWNWKRCLSVARKCQTKGEFKLKYPSAFSACIQNKWLKKACSHMKNKSRQESIGELSTKLFLETLFDHKFNKSRPEWLINPKTNHLLELDGYSPELKIAFEYGDHKNELKSLLGKNGHKARLIKDEVKKRICAKRGVKLIQIPIDVIRLSNPEKEFKSILKKELYRLKIKTSKNIEDINFKIITPSNLKYTKKNVWAIARICKNRDMFERAYKGAFRAAERLGIISEVLLYFRKKNPKNLWTKESVKIEALKYKTRGEFAKKSKGAYYFAIKNNFLNDICSHMKSNQLPWNHWGDKKNIIQALKKCKTRSEFRSQYNAAQRKIEQNNWTYLLDKYLPYTETGAYNLKRSKNKNIKLTFEFCKKSAFKCNSKKEFSNKYPSHYAKARLKNWLPLICSHMMTRSEIIYKNGRSLKNEDIIKIASKFKDRDSFRKKHPFLYKRASKNKIISLIFNREKT